MWLAHLYQVSRHTFPPFVVVGWLRLRVYQSRKSKLKLCTVPVPNFIHQIINFFVIIVLKKTCFSQKLQTELRNKNVLFQPEKLASRRLRPCF